MTKGEQTRQHIIQTAAPIFNRQGYAGTSIGDILTATGLEKGCLYRHFTSKQELAVAATRYTLDKAFEARLGHLEDIADPIEKLRQMIRAFADRPSPVAGGCPLLNTGTDADDTNPELLQLAAESLKTWKQWITRTIKRGQATGQIHPNAVPATIANHIIATLEGAVLICRIEGSRKALKDAATTLERLLLQDLSS